jgi:hypothetical protein
MGGQVPADGRTAIRRGLERARRPDKDQMEALRLKAPYWWVVAFLCVFSAYQIIMNPFGFSDLVQRYTQDISDLLITGPYLYPTAGHDQISVALVEDSTLANLQMPWPWSYGAQARALDALLVYKPRAVIVDLLFVDPRPDPTLPELIEEIHRFQRAGVPLYFAAATDAPPGTAPIRRELLDAGVKTVDPTTEVYQGVVRQYPITGSCFGKEKPPCRSLAFQVYDDLNPKAHAIADPDGEMELMWGTRTDPYNVKTTHLIGDNGEVQSCDQPMSFFTRVWLAFFNPGQVRSRCPYTSIIPAQSLYEGADDPDITRLASGKIVFYGAGLEGVQDKSFSPVNGMIPSVFVHAMALDNLITLRGRPEQNVVTVAGTTLDNNTIQLFGIAPVILILSWIHIRNLRVRAMKRETAKREAGAVFEYVLDKLVESVWHWGAWALALAAGLALTLAAGLSVANWVEVVFVSVELAAMLLVGLPDAIWGYLHHVAGGAADGLERQGETIA